MSDPFKNTSDFSRTKEILDEAAGLTPEEFNRDGVIESYIQRLAQVGTRMGKTVLRKRVQELRKEAADKKKAEAQAEQTQPDKYVVKDGGLAIEKLTMLGLREIQLTNFTAEITADLAIDDGSEDGPKRFYEIAATIGDTTHTVSIKASDFKKLEWVPDLLGSGAIIYVGYATEKHVPVAVQILSPNKVEKRIYGYTGWMLSNETPIYLHGGGGLGANGPVPDLLVDLKSSRLDAFRLPAPDSDPTDAIKAALGFLELTHKRITVPAFGAHLRALLGNTDYSIYVHGGTGRFKTRLALLIQQFYGADFSTPDKLPGSFRSTLNFNEATSFTLKDAICVIDDFHPSANNIERDKIIREATDLIRSQGNQSGRGRMRRDRTLEAPTWPRGVLFITGEDEFPGQSLNSRLFSLEIGDGDIEKAKLTECQQQAAEGLYVRFTSAYVQWLAAKLPDIRKWFSSEVLRLQQLFTHDHPRINNIRAQLQAAYGVFAGFLVAMGVHTDDQSTQFMRVVADALGEAAAAQKTSADSDPCHRFPELLISAVGSGEAHIAGVDGELPSHRLGVACGWRRDLMDNWKPQGLRIGWIDGDNLYLDPQAAYKAAQKMAPEGRGIEVGINTLCRRLRDKGLLVESSEDRILARHILQGSRKRVLHLRPEFLFPRDEPDPADEPTTEFDGHKWSESKNDNFEQKDQGIPTEFYRMATKEPTVDVHVANKKIKNIDSLDTPDTPGHNGQTVSMDCGQTPQILWPFSAPNFERDTQSSISDAENDKSLCFFPANPGDSALREFRGHCGHPNEIKDLDDPTFDESRSTSANIFSSTDSNADYGDGEPDQSDHEDELVNFSLIPASLADEIASAIPGSRKVELVGDDDLPNGNLEVNRFPCPFARRGNCDLRANHYADASGSWRFMCEYGCRHEEFIPALAEAYPAFADLLRRRGIRRGGPEWCVDICRDRRIPLRLEADGSLIVGAAFPDYQDELKTALETHCEAIARIITDQRANLADATEYEDAEFPCDHATMDSNLAIIATCSTGVHSAEEIAARWAEIASDARK